MKPEVKRSPKWRALRAKILKGAVCTACGSSTNLEVHHIKPVHLKPELELVESNLIVLCEQSGRNCHFVFGHFHDWKDWNPEVILMVTNYNDGRIKVRK